MLFEGSLRDNLLLQRSGSGQWTDGALKVWLERLDLVHLLARPEGLDGQLHLSLDCFSGGEIRRLALQLGWVGQEWMVPARRSLMLRMATETGLQQLGLPVAFSAAILLLRSRRGSA